MEGSARKRMRRVLLATVRSPVWQGLNVPTRYRSTDYDMEFD